MTNKKFTKSEQRVTKIMRFILENYNQEYIKQDVEVLSELILVARIIHQRFKISWGEKIKKNQSVEFAKKEILKEIKNDEYYDLIKKFISDYRQSRDTNLKTINN